MPRSIISLVKEGSRSLGSKVSKPGTKVSPSLDGKTVERINNQVKTENFKFRWRVHGTHIITNVPQVLDLSKYVDERMGIKIAAFDLDDTLVRTKSPMKFARDSNDWKWWSQPDAESKVPETLIRLNKEKYIIVIFTNQGAVVANNDEPKSKSYAKLCGRVENIIASLNGESEEKFEVLVFASPKRPGGKRKKPMGNVSSEEDHDFSRKPNVGMWEHMVKYLKEQNERVEVSIQDSFYVGDAAGRGSDHLDSDLKYAENLGLNFKLPEDIFI